MKKSVLTILILCLVFLPIINAVSTCELEVSLINQDPYPAIPGDEVKVVFQISGLSNPLCGTVDFSVKEEYPFTIDPSSENPIQIRSGTYSKSYSSFYIAPYTLRVDENALEGDNPLEISYSASSVEKLKEFNINIEDTKADFEVHVKNYDYITHTLTLEILNIENVDVEALTLEIPKQENISVKGANVKVIGDLDSNEYTTADFEVIVSEGETNIELNLIYTDSINERREITKEVVFDSSYFTDRNGGQKKTPWVWIILVVAVIVWIIYRRHKKKKMKQKLMKRH